MHKVLERHQHKVALAKVRVGQAQLVAAVHLAVHPQQVQIDDARTVGAGALGAVASHGVLDLHQLVQQNKRGQLGLDLDHRVGKRVLAALVGRLALVNARAAANAGHGNLRDQGLGGTDVLRALAQVGAQGHKGAAGLRAGDGPKAVQELRKAAHVMHADNVGAKLDGAQAHAVGGGVALVHVSHAGDRANKALAAHGAQQRIAQRSQLGGLALDNDVLVRVLAKTRAGVDADALAGHAGMDQRAGLVGEKAHDAAHDGCGIRQGEAAQLRGRSRGGIAARAAGHDGGELVVGGHGAGLFLRSLGGGLCLGGLLLSLGGRQRGGLGGSLLLGGLAAVGQISKRKLRLHQAAQLQTGTTALRGLGGLGRGLRLRSGSGGTGLLGHKRGGAGVQLHRGMPLGSLLGGLARVHDDHAAVAVLNKLHHLGIGEAGDVVHNRSAHAHRGLGHVNVTRVDRYDGTLLCQRAHHRQHATSLLVRTHRSKARTRGLPANIDDVGTLVQHLQAVCNGGVGVKVLAAVAKTIGRDVENTHDAGSIKLELELTATPCFRIVCHEYPFVRVQLPLLYPD